MPIRLLPEQMFGPSKTHLLQRAPSWKQQLGFPSPPPQEAASEWAPNGGRQGFEAPNLPVQAINELARTAKTKPLISNCL